MNPHTACSAGAELRLQQPMLAMKGAPCIEHEPGALIGHRWMNAGSIEGIELPRLNAERILRPLRGVPRGTALRRAVRLSRESPKGRGWGVHFSISQVKSNTVVYLPGEKWFPIPEMRYC